MANQERCARPVSLCRAAHPTELLHVCRILDLGESFKHLSSNINTSSNYPPTIFQTSRHTCMQCTKYTLSTMNAPCIHCIHCIHPAHRIHCIHCIHCMHSTNYNEYIVYIVYTAYIVYIAYTVYAVRTVYSVHIAYTVLQKTCLVKRKGILYLF